MPKRGQVVGSDAGAMALLVVDADRTCVEANRAACELLGRQRDAVVGATIDELIVPEMRVDFARIWEAFADRGGHAGPFELEDFGKGSARVDIVLRGDTLPERYLVTLVATGPPQQALGRRPGGGRFGPSAREREVLGLLATGATDEEIAELLSVSPATVQTHVRNAKVKLGATTRAHAIAIALERGAIE